MEITDKEVMAKAVTDMAPTGREVMDTEVTEATDMEVMDMVDTEATDTVVIDMVATDTVYKEPKFS